MNLREARFKARLTQFDLRIRTGIHQSKISYIERGYITPRPDEKKALATALGIDEREIEFDGPTDSGN